MIRILVFGSIGYGGFEDRNSFIEKIRKEGFHVIDHVEFSPYYDVNDFRDKPDLVEEIVEGDINSIDEYCDVAIVIGIKPSWGTAIEQKHAWNKKIPVILFVPLPVPTPWPLYYSNYICKTFEEILTVLKEIKTKYYKKEKKQNENL